MHYFRKCLGKASERHLKGISIYEIPTSREIRESLFTADSAAQIRATWQTGHRDYVGNYERF